VTTADERRGVLEAVERVANVGESVVPRALAAVRRLYPDAKIANGQIVARAATHDDALFLDRVSTLISAHLSSAEDA